jgi:hypothetical protein
VTIGGPAVIFKITDDSEIEDYPKEIVPEGLLSWKRKAYLHQKIRPYCDDAYKDLLCPDPGPEPLVNIEETGLELEEEEEIVTPKTKKKLVGNEAQKRKRLRNPARQRRRRSKIFELHETNFYYYNVNIAITTVKN